MSAAAQTSPLGNWLIYIGDASFGSRWHWHQEVQHRNYDLLGDLEQLLVRTGLGYDLTPASNLHQGYAFILSENYINSSEKEVTKEHRLYQQFIQRQTFKGVNLTHRYRFEQRFFEDDFQLRFRYFVTILVPLKDERLEPGTWYLSAYNELFLNAGQKLFDRNRLYGGLGYKVSRAIRAELGYMNQFFRQGGRDQLNLWTFVNF